MKHDFNKSVKTLKKKQNGNRTTKKNTKKHKQTHQARCKKSRGMLGGENNTKNSSVNKSNNGHNPYSRSRFIAKEKDRKKKSQNKVFNILGHNAGNRYTWNTETRREREREQAEKEHAEDKDAQIRSEELHRGPLGFFKVYLGVGGLAVVLYALFGNDLI